MEAVAELSVNSIADTVKVNTVSDTTAITSVEADSCHKSNGIVESEDIGCPDAVASEPDSGHNTDCIPNITENALAESHNAKENYTEDVATAVELETTAAVDNLVAESNCSNMPQDIADEVLGYSEEVESQDIGTLQQSTDVNNLETSSDKVTFKTEVLVEKNGNDLNMNDSNVHDNANILSELGQGELSEALRSSDTTENVENNNSGKEEVFNKEELLDILEGNDVGASEDIPFTEEDAKKILESHIALKQLSRLKLKKQHQKKTSVDSKTKRKQSFDKSSGRKKKNPKRKSDANDGIENIDTGDGNSTLEVDSCDIEESIVTAENDIVETDKGNSIVNVLVKDWDDDEPSEMDQCNKLVENSDKLLKACDQVLKTPETVVNEEIVSRASTDSPVCEGQKSSEKKGDGDQPQRRLGRVIKKKVIFDPDNPDTFTKGKIKIIKCKESQSEKVPEQLPIKKIKTEVIPPRAKSKSPLSKMAWKKPSPRTSIKQNKRLTEVDKLLMDEGAVNMIYQLTPEAPKGKKNVRTKAEFIKKLQSSTPDGKEMKFRERKKEALRSEDEAKKILGGKHRTSLSSSVKSPSVCEDFETQSADDSIIYRRHSSSSYSSSCMSPRRLSDVDPGAVLSAARAMQISSDLSMQTAETSNSNQGPDFLKSEPGNTSNEMINKNDCLSIKEKLNTKLSLALNKRKRDNAKADKPSKQKRVSKVDEKNESIKIEKLDSFKYLTVNFDQRLAEICIKNTGSSLGIELLKELKNSLLFVDSQKNISVTLLTSECGTLCSDLDLRSLLNQNMEKRTNSAYEFAESVRLLLATAEKHSKLLVIGVWEACSGVALSLVALSDMTLASERATFGVSAAPGLLGVSALTSCCRHLPPALVNDMVLLERRLSATEALQGGLVSRILWPYRIGEQVRSVVRDIAAQPLQSVLLKKQLLSLKKSGSTASTFLSDLEKERDLLVQYWTSVEGQELLRAAFETA